MSKCVVLFSGGQDSTTCLALATALYDEVHALSVFYGQKHERELKAATKIAKMLNVKHEIVTMHALSQIADSALVTSADIQASGGRADREAPEGLPTSFVPGRNLLLLGLAASYAVKVGARVVMTGVCQTDFSGYPDCRREFIDALELAVTLAMPSSSGPIRIETPLMFLTKAESVDLAWRLTCGRGSLVWDALAESVTCYKGSKCGECPACKLRAAGFAEAGKTDPALEL